MGQTNSNKVSHKLTDLPNTYRDDQLNQILNDLDEDNSGSGFSEVFYLGATPFVSQILTWQTSAKLKKRTVVDFTYSPLPFVSVIVKQFFDEDDDNITVSTITATVIYNANKTVNNIDVVTTRP